jgi:hypothetical protein
MVLHWTTPRHFHRQKEADEGDASRPRIRHYVNCDAVRDGTHKRLKMLLPEEPCEVWNSKFHAFPSLNAERRFLLFPVLAHNLHDHNRLTNRHTNGSTERIDDCCPPLWLLGSPPRTPSMKERINTAVGEINQLDDGIV